MRFSINREPAVALQNSRHELVASAEKIFQSLSSHRFLSGITFGNIAAAKPNFSISCSAITLSYSSRACAKTLMLYPIARLRA